MRRKGVDAEEAVETMTKSRLAGVPAGTHGSQRQKSATTWTLDLRWQLKVLCECMQMIRAILVRTCSPLRMLYCGLTVLLYLSEPTYRPSRSAVPKAAVLVNLPYTPSGVIFDDGFEGELFGSRFSSSYVLILDVGVLIGAATVTVTSCCRSVSG